MSTGAVLRRDEAVALVEAIPDRVVQELLRFAQARLLMPLGRDEDEDQATWAARQPESPLDLYYCTLALQAMFAQHQIIRRVLQGETLAQAGGWDV